MNWIALVFVLASVRNFVRAERVSAQFREAFTDPPPGPLATVARPLLWTVCTPTRIRVFALLGIALFGALLVADL